MLRTDLYIHSYGAVSPEALPGAAADRLLMAEPDYTGIIPPMQLRRMSKAVRTGIWAAQQCLKSGALDTPDAIITGTGFGCLHDTEVFLKKILEQDEHLLAPTAFIQSTHNTVAGQIALMMSCTGYNLTLSQGGHSFENALLATQLYLAENPEHRVLTGGVDELTATSLHLQQRLGVYRPGTPAGEGAAFFMLSQRPAGALMRIAGMKLLTHEAAKQTLTDVIKAAGNTDALLLGESGDAASQPLYNTTRDAFPGRRFHTFKERCGDYPTAAAYGLTYAAGMDAGRILLINHWCESWSVLLVEKV